MTGPESIPTPFPTMGDVRHYIARIRAAWDPFLVPDAAEIMAPDRKGQPVPDQYRGHLTDSGFMREWLGGLRYEQLPGHHIYEVEGIFHYLTESASAYYLGGSLLDWMSFLEYEEDPDDAPRSFSFPGGISSYHLANRMSHPFWLESIEPHLTPQQRSCAHEFLPLLLSYPLSASYFTPEEWQRLKAIADAVG